LIFAGLLISAAGGPAAAQPPGSGRGCYMNDGWQVEYRPALAIPDIALATHDWHTGEPVVYFNPLQLAWLAPQFTEWAYAHECAHHVLGHLRFGPITAAHEAIADCWAIRELVGRGAFTAADVESVQQAIAHLLPGDWLHMPGRYRAIALRRCLD
jgi:hypothetical protein